MKFFKDESSADDMPGMAHDEDWGWVSPANGSNPEPADAPADSGRAVEAIAVDPAEDQSAPETAPAAPESDSNYADSWLRTTSKAAAFAGGLDTPEAWRSVSSAAEVVLEIAQTLAVVAEARQRAEHLAQAAQDAIVEAAEAKQRAEEMAHIEQEATRRADETLGEAASAKENARQLEVLVAQAYEVNSATAWSEVFKKVSGARGIAEPLSDQFSGSAAEARLSWE